MEMDIRFTNTQGGTDGSSFWFFNGPTNPTSIPNMALQSNGYAFGVNTFGSTNNPILVYYGSTFLTSDNVTLEPNITYTMIVDCTGYTNFNITVKQGVLVLTTFTHVDTNRGDQAYFGAAANTFTNDNANYYCERMLVSTPDVDVANIAMGAEIGLNSTTITHDLIPDAYNSGSSANRAIGSADLKYDNIYAIRKW
jgi:hypothetical protein